MRETKLFPRRSSLGPNKYTLFHGLTDCRHLHGPLGWKTVDETARNHLGREIGQAESGEIASSED